MRLAFFILILLLAATVFWAQWTENRPAWRSYQAALRERSEERLLAMLDSARVELARPEVKARLAEIDSELAGLASDTSTAGARERDLSRRLETARRERRAMRARIRATEGRFWTLDATVRYRALRSLLDEARDDAAVESGRWPPDEERQAELQARSDSLAALVAAFTQPVDTLNVILESLVEREKALFTETRTAAAARETLAAERDAILQPVVSVENALRQLRARAPGVREIASGNEIARCPTCHGDLRDVPPAHSPLANAELFADEPCTVCHGGDGRALDVDRAHQGLLAGGGGGVGPYSLQGRIDLLASDDPAVRREAMNELREVTGIEPPVTEASTAGANSPEVQAWLDWWRYARRYFEPAPESGTTAADGTTAGGGAPAGIDPWSWSRAGRPLRYVGSRECLGCHLTSHREHCERWMASKFKSADRLAGEANPEPCYACHMTGYDPATGTYAEAGVTCEACHGPGERYSAMMFAGVELVGRGDSSAGTTLLDQASKLAREAIGLRTLTSDYGQVNVCVSCHHPRIHKEGGPGQLEHAFMMTKMREMERDDEAE